MGFWCGRRDSNSHAEALDPKSSVSTNSTTSAKKRGWYARQDSNLRPLA